MSKECYQDLMFESQKELMSDMRFFMVDEEPKGEKYFLSEISIDHGYNDLVSDFDVGFEPTFKDLRRQGWESCEQT